MNGAADAVRLSMMTAYPLARKCSVAAAPLTMTPSSDSQGKGTEAEMSNKITRPYRLPPLKLSRNRTVFASSGTVVPPEVTSTIFR